MNPSGFFPKLNELDNQLKSFFESNDINESLLYDIQQFIVEKKVQENITKLKIVLNLLSIITAYHHVGLYFYEKFDKIIQILNPNIFKEKFKPAKLFKIFKFNKKALAYLYFNNILLGIDESLKSKKKYKEMSSYIHSFSNANNSYENSLHIAALIRQDCIDDFIVYFHKNNLSFKMEISPDKSECNNYLMQRSVSLIEYASFFGSIQIFKFLQINGVKLKPSLWNAAIHSNNEAIIYELVNYSIEPPNGKYDDIIREAIKCHNNEVALYLITKFTDNKPERYYPAAFEYYNFAFFLDNLDYYYLYLFAFEYNYDDIVASLIKAGHIKPNQSIIIFHSIF